MYKCLLSVCLILLVGCEAPSVKRIILTDKAPSASTIYSQAIEVDGRLFLSGQIGRKPDSTELVGDDLESQTHQTIKNIQAILEAAGYELSDVVEAQVFLSDINNYQAFNDIYVQYFTENPPARAVVEVSRIPRDAKVEIKVSAAK